MMRHFLNIAAILSVTTALATATTKGWTTDFEAAKAQAKKKGKSLLVDFTGSDWCAPCKKLHKEVFSKSSFIKEASKDFILVELDFPRKTKFSAELKAKNEKLAKKYKVRGFPSVLLMDSKGKVFKSTTYQAGGVKPYLAMIQTSLKAKKFR